LGWISVDDVFVALYSQPLIAKTAVKDTRKETVWGSVADPDPNLDPPDPHVFRPPGSGSGSFYHEAKIVRKPLISAVL
jgi:hypothetical protein